MRRELRRALVGLLAAALLPACVTTPPGPGDEEEGLASFYADSLEGRRTASGEPYDAAAATCAHRTHPFGTRLRVEVVDTSAKAICRVNDRGPFARGRVIDVSRALAEELGIVQRGVAPVRLRVLR